MRASVYRGEAGFWMARIEGSGRSPERASGAEKTRTIIIPIPRHATRTDAERALVRIAGEEPGFRHGHR